MKIVVAACIACLTSLSNAATDPSTLETPPTKTMKVVVPVVWQNTWQRCNTKLFPATMCQHTQMKKASIFGVQTLV